MTYTVKPGDTLWGISNQYGVSVTELARINNVTADKLRVGQVLTIPSKSGTNPSNMFIYTVQKGDRLRRHQAQREALHSGRREHRGSGNLPP